MLILVGVLAIIGWFRGLVAQVAAVLGIASGVWFGAIIKQWVGVHWNGAHPTAVFWALSWVIAVFAGLAVVSLVNVLGDRLGQALQAGPLAWVDRGLGVFAGAALGIIVSSLVVLSAARLPLGLFVEDSLVEARASRPLLIGGERACERLSRFPGARGLKREYAFACRRWDRETPGI